MIKRKLEQVASTPNSQLEVYADFIRSIVARHGPTPEEDSGIHRVVHQAYTDLHCGRLVMNDILFLRAQFGDALSSCETLQGHALAKPYGYPGDFKLFDKIYQQHLSPNPKLRRWDEFFHRLDACKAVCNRKSWLFGQLERKGADYHRPLNVLIVGSGPGRNVFEFLQQYPDGACFDCVELDPKAIDYATRLCKLVASKVRFRQGSILRYRTETRYDVIWSGGLFDYFNDRVFGRAVSHLMDLLAEGGELIVGNFASPNSSQGFMELISDWKLTLRTPDELRCLATQMDLDGARVQVDREPAGVNLFLRLSR